MKTPDREQEKKRQQEKEREREQEREKKKDRDIETLKKQAQGLSNEYNRLGDQVSGSDNTPKKDR